MKFLRNRHLRVAMFIAPVLAIGSYWAVDYTVSERPKTARRGQSYPLAEKSNCRYESGVCTLKNGDVEVKVFARRLNAARVELKLVAAHAFENVVVSHGANDTFTPPRLMAVQAPHNQWVVELGVADPRETRLRWGLSLDGTNYYAETSARFVDRNELPGKP